MDIRKLKIRTVETHILCWLMFFLYEVLVNYTFAGKFSNVFDYIGHYILNIGLFYLNAYITFEKGLNRKSKAIYFLVLFIVLEIVAYIVLKILLYKIFLYFNIYNYKELPSAVLFIAGSVWRAIYFIGLSTAYWFFLNKIKTQDQIAEMETQRLKSLLEKEELERNLIESENSFLKAQINPHFLFNILGFMHNLMLKHSETAADTLILLSDIMRYALDTSQKDGKVELRYEVEHINNYILINQIRFGNKLNLKFNCDEDTLSVKVIPLLFITIIENIFKYGDLMNPDFPAVMELKIEDKDLILTVNNKKNLKGAVHSSGIGMANIEKRLQQHYKNRYQLFVNNSEDRYSLNLKISNIYD
ncbi:MAG: yehU 6 [Mucilaginibacter sp.]|nr:yehU 6 [Mucilaginibacter sp.]